MASRLLVREIAVLRGSDGQTGRQLDECWLVITASHRRPAQAPVC